MVEAKLYDTRMISPRAILLKPKTPSNSIYMDKFHIEEVEFTSTESVKLGDRVKVSLDTSSNSYNTYYNCNYMYKEDASNILVNEFEENDTSVYILPLLEIKSNHLLLDKTFVNCYIEHYDFKHPLGEFVYLIYRYLPVNYYAKFVSAFQNLDNCKYYQRDKDKRFDCFVLKIEDKFVKDVKLILEGKFSKISEEAKNLILRFHNQQNPETPLSQILYKGELRRNELEEFLDVKIPDNIDYATKPDIVNERWSYSK